MVGGNAAQGGKSPLGKPLVGVIIVEVRDPFPGLAAEFAQVMSGGGTGDEAQINEPSPGPEGRETVMATWWTPAMCSSVWKGVTSRPSRSNS